MIYVKDKKVGGKIVTIMNMKGGVGKTTVTVNLGGILSRHIVGGKSPLNVLIVDYDPQFNLSQAFLDSRRYFFPRKRKEDNTGSSYG